MDYIKRILKKMYILRKNHGKVKLGSGVNVSRDATFCGSNRIGKNSSFTGILGHASYIGTNSHISASVGKYCCIAANVNVVNGTHPTSKFVSICPAFYSTIGQCGFSYCDKNKFKECTYADEVKKLDIKVGNDVWIGFGATILAGITIGNGAIIAAGSVVTTDVEPYSIVGGVPAKRIRYRFTDCEIQFLENFKWWDKPSEWIKKNSELFEDIDLFVEECNK